MKRGRSRAEWSDLPKELLETIAGHLQTKTDVCRFRSVCKSWRLSVPPFKNPFFFPLCLPFFEPINRHQAFLSLTQSTLYYLNQPSLSPSSSSSRGWLVKIREGRDDLQNHLINPLSPLKICPFPDPFPKTLNLSNFRVFEVAKCYGLQFPNGSFGCFKVAFSPNPRPSLMIVTSGLLWHLQLSGHDNRWVLIDDMISPLSYDDVVLYRGKFFAVDDYGRAVLIDPSSLGLTEIVPRMIAREGQKKRLVKSKGELLLVDRYPDKKWDKSGDIKVEFRVFKLEIEQKRWVEVKSLDDRILFLGHDCSFTLPARCFGGGCKGNCIVFADPVFMVFSLNDGKLSPMDQHPEYISIFYPPST
ncbi:hypothetical protein TIFTF001_002187 [Ficus carica]|uniref:F-box protein n=1 Tax=Ficus carica TaxID=3494 RepID=A0AA87ZSM8_FICCA|nr:hypothetical protein TIFTF001_002187 [Ficus carica]